jgi:ABC-type dipeptide/oligopeptide/nickel transport system permease component
MFHTMPIRATARSSRVAASANGADFDKRRQLLMLMVLGVSAFCIALCAALPEGTKVSIGLGDKFDHFAAFAALAAMCAAVFPGLALGYLQTAMVAFGAAIELVQAIPALQRNSDAKDLLADAAGAAAALVLVFLWRYGAHCKNSNRHGLRRARRR